MNKIVKILIAVISVCCASILIYFLVLKSNNFEHDHPKNISSKINDSQPEIYAVKSKFITENNQSPNKVQELTGRPNDNLENFKMHKNYKLFNSDECGVQTGVHRVHNGKVTGLMENPWMVALVYANEKTNTSVDCAGTLISENLVLTAAHCLVKRKPIAIRLGDYNITSDPDCVHNGDKEKICAEKVQEITDFKILIHEDHWAQVFEDIALIKLNEPARLQQNNINTICLPFAKTNIESNDIFYITGWGRIDNNNTFSDVLLGTYVDYIPHEECKKTITATLTKGHICAGRDDGSDSCRGDSGGPLIQPLFDGQKARSVQIGIVSYGPSGDCGKGPGVYTYIHRYLEWILNKAEF